VTLFYYALWMLCGIGGAILGVDAAYPRRNLVALATGFAAGVTLFRHGLPDLPWIAGAMAVVAALRVVRSTPFSAAMASATAGLVAAAWAVLFQALGLPAIGSLALAAVVPTVSAVLAARSRAFAPRQIRDEALLILTALAAGLAVAPGLVAGWQSAGALNLEGKREIVQALPQWTILMTVAAASLGGAYTLWTRR
jgi:hypothetical protein